MWNFLTRAGVTLAGLPFIRGLNAPETYANRIKRDFRLHDYADVWNPYRSAPAYWERYYNPLPNDPEWKDAFVRDSVAVAGIPSRRNVFEYDYPAPASETRLSEAKSLGQASDPPSSFADRFGNWTASSTGSVTASPGEPLVGPSRAVRPEDLRRLTRKNSPIPADGFASGSTPVPYLASPEFNDRFGNRSKPSDDRSSQQPTRPNGAFPSEPSYLVPPPIRGFEDQNNTRRR